MFKEEKFPYVIGWFGFVVLLAVALAFCSGCKTSKNIAVTKKDSFVNETIKVVKNSQIGTEKTKEGKDSTVTVTITEYVPVYVKDTIYQSNSKIVYVPKIVTRTVTVTNTKEAEKTAVVTSEVKEKEKTVSVTEATKTKVVKKEAFTFPWWWLLLLIFALSLIYKPTREWWWRQFGWIVSRAKKIF